MVDPAFSHMRINRAFDFMAAAVRDFEVRLQSLSASGETFSLDAAMSHLTADVITRTIFSVPLEGDTSQQVFEDFMRFERQVGSIDIKRLLVDKPWSPTTQPQPVRDACARIRRHLGTMLDTRIATEGLDDIAGAVLDARDTDTGQPFTREELIDQLGVFFLAGHETTASSLTWAFYILSERPDVVARMREEVERVVGDGPVRLEHTKRLPYVRNFFREVLRLYPPITFLPRVAAKDTEIAGRRVKRGTMLMIAPWSMHRHQKMWVNPDRFDPDRFLPEREHEMTPGADSGHPGAWIRFHHARRGQRAAICAAHDQAGGGDRDAGACRLGTANGLGGRAEKKGRRKQQPLARYTCLLLPFISALPPKLLAVLRRHAPASRSPPPVEW